MGGCCSRPSTSDYDGFMQGDDIVKPERQNKHRETKGGGGGGAKAGAGIVSAASGGVVGGGVAECGSIVRVRGSSNNTSMFVQQGRKGVNQDAMTVWENFAGDKDMTFCGVFDGHGPSGHKIANHVRDVLPSKLYSAIRRSQLNSHAPSGDGAQLLSLWENSIMKTFKEMDDQVCHDPNLDCFCSGTTAVTVIKQGEHLIISNLGDSRAVLCTRGDKNQLVPVQLTSDLKPNVASEAKRIKDSRGRVFAMDIEPDVMRIWMPDEDYPVVKIVASAKKRSSAAQLLVQRAVKAWKKKFPGSKIDDCAVICLFLKDKPCLSKSMSDVYMGKKDPPKLTISRSCRSYVSEGGAPLVANENIVVKTVEDTKEEEFSTVGGVSTLNSLVNMTVPDQPKDGLRWRKPGTEKS
ncbi:hypothetical protein ACFE04_000422 [Oxalis oulophora]